MPISNLVFDFVDDLRAPGMLWQGAAVVLSVLLGWALARALRPLFEPHGDKSSAVLFGVQSFGRVLSPLLMLGFLEIGKLILAHWQHVNLLRLAMPLLGSLALIRFSFFLMRRVFARHGQVGAAILTFEKIFSLLVWLAVALYLTGLWPDIFDFLDDTTLPIGSHKVALSAILQAAVSSVVMIMLALWAGAALDERLMKVQGLNSSMRVVLARTSRAVLVLVAILVSLSMVGIDLTVLSVFGGALGVGLGFGMQKIASNYISGFIILLDRSLSIGDMISVDKYSGRVTQINTRYTVLQGLDGVESLLPNEMLVSGAMQNYSLSNTRLRVATQLTVAYDTDLASLLPQLEQAAAGVPRVLADPTPGATLNKFGADGFELEVGFWIADPENGRGGVISEVNKKIWALLKQTGVNLPYATREIRLSDAGLAAAIDIALKANKSNP